MTKQKNLTTKNQVSHAFTYIIDPYPTSGHFNGMMNFAVWLRNKMKYRIVFLGEITFKRLCESEGFEFFEVPSIIFIPEKAELVEKGILHFFLSCLYENRHISLQKRFEACTLMYKKIVDQICPDVIILDDHYASKAFFYEQFKLPILLATTMISPERRHNIPPFQFSFIPKPNLWSKVYCNFLWEYLGIKKYFSRLGTKISCIGNTNRKFTNKLYSKSKFSMNESRCLGIGIVELPIIALYPRAFDFKGDPKQNSYFYFEELPKLNIYSTIETRLESVLKFGTKKNMPIIYCSLGTVSSNFEASCKIFLKKMIKLASIYKSYQFILNIGEHIESNFLPSLTNNVSLFKKVPQLYVLKYCTVMVTHGGLNSIKECIDACVPMLICPLTDRWDQPGNAARCVYHQIGEAGSIKSDGAYKLGKKLKILVEKNAIYRNNIHKMKEKIGQSKENQLRIMSDKISESIN